jgi:predicted phosphodiesterase
MRRIAIISDIHSNMAALEAVVADIGTQRVDAVYCLGDVVGYGPQPVEAMKVIISICEPGKILCGNHDHAVVHEPIGFNAEARNAALWTNQVTRAGFMSFIGGKRRRWNWLRELPTSFTEGDVLFVHASPRQHLEEYILEEHTNGRSLMGEDPRQLLEENFALVDHTCFIGHTHRPGVITDGDYHWNSLQSLELRWKIDKRKTIINVGSVGQPRDGDPRACYVVFDGASVEWRRVAYDAEKTRQLIIANPMLGNHLGDRLLIGR